MKQQISPRIAVAAVAVVVLIVGVIAWKMFTRPQAAHIVFQNSDPHSQVKNRMVDQTMQSARTVPDNPAPAQQGGQ